MSNFKFPYFSRDIGEFWRRWHISLSTWFRDYLYIPLGGSKRGKWLSIRNIFIIFIVSGFWHGANWTFIMWGFIHAMLYVPLFLKGKNRQYTTSVVAEGKWLPSFKELFQMGSTFFFTMIAWVFFRSESVSDGFFYLLNILKSIGIPSLHRFGIVFIILIIILDWIFKKDERKVIGLVSFKNHIVNRIINIIICYFLLFMIIQFYKVNSTFIYFQF